MHKLPVIKGRELVKFLESIGFRVIKRFSCKIEIKGWKGNYRPCTWKQGYT